MCTQRPSGDSSTVDISLSAGSKCEAPRRLERSRVSSRTSSPSAAAARSSAISVGSPARRRRPSPSSALLHALARARDRADDGCDSSLASAGAGRCRPDTRDVHPVLRQRPGLVGADDVRGPQRLDRAQALDERAAPGEHPDADGQRERDRGQQPLGDVGDEQPDREHDRVGERKPGSERCRAERTRRRRRRRRPRSARRRGEPARSSGLSSRSTRSRQRGDSAELGAHPCGEGDALALRRPCRRCR